MDAQKLTASDFQRMNVNTLRQYLRDRGLRSTGLKADLVARAFVAHESNVPLVPMATERSSMLASDFKAALQTPDGELPTPDSLVDWESEQSMHKWPPTLIQDIALFLSKRDSFRVQGTPLADRLLNDYKEQKAYSYFTSQWLLEIFYHPITTDSKYCYLKAMCSPSQRMSEKAHEVWVALHKETGTINSAFCSCFSGASQTCNHIAALLFKVDFCWQYGYIKKSVTSRPCAWTQKGKSLMVEPQKVADMNIVKPKATRKKPMTSSHTKEKTAFKPHLADAGMSFKEFCTTLGEIRPQAVMLGEASADRYYLYKQWDMDQLTSSHRSLPPPPLTQLVFSNNNLTFSRDDVVLLEQATIGQSNNPVWMEQRKGRCTASYFKDICTFMNKSRTDAQHLIAKIMQTQSAVPSDIPALKYGRRMEDVAAVEYQRIMTKQKHKHLCMKQAGLFVMQEYCYVGASPDRLVYCQCCGHGIVEIKCPIRCADKAPSSDVLEYLVDDGGLTKLNPNHKYFFQIQGQMAICNCKWGDFFVYSHHGSYLERIVFQEDLWHEIIDKVSGFWLKFLQPELTAVPSYTDEIEVGDDATM